ncbi:membrane protein implicated in regulation of membrane protease activity [Arthrobacter roseus]|nr:membrane protein implicated in regulation of membrane protease activity [Arthrobacter roseus]
MSGNEILQASGLTLAFAFVILLVGLAVGIDPGILAIVIASLSVFISLGAMEWLRRRSAPSRE